MKKFGYSKGYFHGFALTIAVDILMIKFFQETYVKLILMFIGIFGVYAIFRDYYSYFIVDEEKISYKKPGKITEINWDDVVQIGIPHQGLFQMIVYSAEGKFLIITYWFDKYRELARHIVDKCKHNRNIKIDDRLINVLTR